MTKESKTINGVVINPDGINLENGETLCFGHTFDVTCLVRSHIGPKTFSVVPHGFETEFVVLQSDVMICE